MFLRNRLGAIGAALVSLGVLAGGTSAPARAATPPVSSAGAVTAQAPGAGSILCSGDLCLQTISYNTRTHTAKINAWADTKRLNPGYFTLDTPPDSSGVSEFLFSPVRRWPAGGTHYTFTAQLEHGTYDMTAYSGNIPGSPVGEKGFGINF
jgi:hypothetical protein